MKILLDTHIILWSIANDPRLSPKAKGIIERADNEVFYSIISLWETELKRMAHPAEMSISAEQAAAYCHEQGYSRLALKKKHIYALSALKLEESAPPHKDPFDRILKMPELKQKIWRSLRRRAPSRLWRAVCFGGVAASFVIGHALRRACYYYRRKC